MRFCSALALSLLPHAALTEPARLELSAHVIVDKAPEEFGGLSGMLLSPDGTEAQVVNDRGRLFTVYLERDDTGTLIGVEPEFLQYVLQQEDNDDIKIDTEGLAFGPGNSVYISFEQPARVSQLLPGEKYPTALPVIPDLETRSKNRGFEALATDNRGAIYVLPEAPTTEDNGFPLYRFFEGDWSIQTEIPQDGSFLMVGADFGPDGKLYLLERAVSLLGFRSRISRLALEDTEESLEILYESRVSEFDNLEAISIWPDPDGTTRITLASDDNLLPVQRTEFVEFVLIE